MNESDTANINVESFFTVSLIMLNDFFSSVFTKELETDMPVLDNLCDAKLVDISVTVEYQKQTPEVEGR